MAYTYIITHIPSNVNYYGVRYAKNCSPSDLGVTYFSSSKVLKRLIAEEGTDNFKFMIRKTFDSKEAALAWEHRFLTKINASQSDRWFNLNNGAGPNSGNLGGYKLSKVTKEKMSKPKDEAHRKKLAEHLSINRVIPVCTDEIRLQRSQRMLGNDINKGKKRGPHSPERLAKMSEALMGNTNGKGPRDLKELTCPHCSKVGRGPNMSRYHFSNCKGLFR